MKTLGLVGTTLALGKKSVAAQKGGEEIEFVLAERTGNAVTHLRHRRTGTERGESSGAL